MKMFDSKQTERYFKDCLDFMPKDKAGVFTQEVKDTFWNKNLSEEGEYDNFKVTKKDIRNIVEQMVHTVGV